MSENNDKKDFTIDQRLRTIKDTVDKWCYAHYVPPKTVTKTAEQYLTEDQGAMENILKECQEAQKTVDEMSTLLVETNEFCDDLDVEIKKAYEMYGLEIPSAEQLLGTALDSEDEEAEEETTNMEKGLENLELGSGEIGHDENKSPGIEGLTFYEPTPAKAKPTTHKKLF